MIDAVRRAGLLLLAIVLFSAAAGWSFSAIFGTGRPLASTLYGVFFGAPLLAYERGMLWPGLRARVRRAATPVFIAATLLIFVAAFVIGTTFAGLTLWATGMSRSPLLDAAPTPQKLAYAFAVAALIVSAFRLRDLIGPSIFLNFLIGRYHKPIREERIFLFVDLADSTRFAERHGDLCAMRYLGRAFEVLAEPVRHSRGSIDDYVGDMALVTWTMREGLRDAAAIRCVFAFLDQIEQDSETWLRDFGEVPRFRAALHCGPVVVAEIGLDRHKIAYFGDVVNTTARLEALAKELNEPVVASADLLDRLACLPDGVMASDLGQHVVRGRNERLGVLSLHRTCGTEARLAGEDQLRPSNLDSRQPRSATAYRVRLG